MQTKIPTSFSVVSRYYDESGALYDEMRSQAEGCIEIKDAQTRILYREKNEGVVTVTDMSFTDKSRITLRKSGAARYECIFAVGERSKFIYYAPPLSFDAEVTAQSIKNTICIAGGRIEIKYSMNMGGHNQTVSVQIDAEAK